MTNNDPPSTRLLFIIDEDYGALGLAMYILFRQASLNRATLAIPQRIYDLHEGQISVSSYPYRSLQDILRLIDTDRPDIVFLVSGYSYAYQNLLSIRELRKLLRLLEQRNCKIATSDPYLGTFRQIVNSPARNGAFQRSLKRRLRWTPRVYAILADSIRYLQNRKLRRFVREVADCLKDVQHFCPVPKNLLPAGRTNYVGFFNPLAIYSNDDLQAISAAVSAFHDISVDRPRWLFVLARFDLEFQEQKFGNQGFAEIVADKLRQSLDNGKHPTFIGPAAFVEKLSQYFAEDSGVSLLSACPFEEFQQRLFDAEIVFYWQIFSTSTFLRLMNGLPVFFFDKGHTARFFTPMHKAGLKSYYLAGSPHYLDIEQALDANALAALSAEFQQSALDSREILEQVPTPPEMVDAILGAS
jgi:hypothetical protein